MNGHELDDRTNKGLASLAVLSPDDARAARVGARCRAQLARRACTTLIRGHDEGTQSPLRGPRSLRSLVTPDAGRRVIAPAVVLAVCAVYVYSLISTALEITRLL